MKHIALLLFPLAAASAAQVALPAKGVSGTYDLPETPPAFDHTHTNFTALLRAHVRDARVDYKALADKPEALAAYLDALAAVPLAAFNRWTEEQQIACLVNLYNASTLDLVRRHYPLKSIKDIGGWFSGPWDQPTVRAFGQVFTLDALEHGILRAQFDEPRIHFALVCAAKGCPPLRDEAYRPGDLDAQFDDQGVVFLGTVAKNRVAADDGRLYLSPIFKWFKEDFTGDGSVQDFVRPYFPEDQRAAVTDKLRIRYTDYDWTLNDQAR